MNTWGSQAKKIEKKGERSLEKAKEEFEK